MTPQQEDKLDTVHDALIRMEERAKIVDERWMNNRDSILQIAKDHFKLEKKVDADRNMVKGVLWLGGTGFFATVIGFVYSFFKH